MSKFTVESMLYKLTESRALVAEFVADPDEVMDRFPLTAVERQRLRDWDVLAIVAAGASPMVTMLAFTAVHGPAARPDYIRRMNSASLAA